MPRRERWIFCQGATSDSVIVTIRGDRRNYMFLLVERRNMRGARRISAAYLRTRGSVAAGVSVVSANLLEESLRLGNHRVARRNGRISFERFCEPIADIWLRQEILWICRIVLNLEAQLPDV